MPYEHSPRTCTAGTVALPPVRCLLAEVTVGRHCFTQRYSSKEEEEEEEGSFKEEESLFKADAEGWG